MDFDQFQVLAKSYNVIPVYERITADLLTPVLAYLKIRRGSKFCFLLESVEGIGRLARYSFLGKNPLKIISNKKENIVVFENGKKQEIQRNIFRYLQEEIREYSRPKINDLPDFTGGIVGYLGYENVALIEEKICFKREQEINTPDSIFAVYNTIIAFDHYKHQLILITNVFIEKSKNLRADYNKARNELKKLHQELSRPIDYKTDFQFYQQKKASNNRKQFYNIVESGKKNIFDGDVFQIVLSKRFTASYQGDLLNVYRALRIINPSPYMYFIEFEDDFTIIGTSPEDLLKVKDRKATILPIAGTRKRGKSPEEDHRLEVELLADPKERAEHVMLVDLARNDLGRVCQYASVEVKDSMHIQKFSHVMHIVSRVEGVLEDGKDCIDALMAGFPAGTLTGAPKIRAIQLIDQYENQTRNVYGGAVGYIDFSGNLDMCIAIRTLFAKKDIIYWQAGAGIVADSKPELEHLEINNKSAVLLSALKYAEVLDEDFSY
jgi:anthranilate synthase component 1